MNENTHNAFRWPLILGLLLLAAALFAVDQSLTDWLHAQIHRFHGIRHLIWAVNSFFDWWLYVAVAALLLLDTRRIRMLRCYVLTLAGSAVVLHGLKFLIGRARPGLDLGPLAFAPLSSPSLEFDSFPSGHAFAATLMTLIIQRYLPGSVWLLAPLAAMVCLSRAAFERHFPSDIVAGIALALITMHVALRVEPDGFPVLFTDPQENASETASRANAQASEAPGKNA
ncbi:MAG: phosphatase PAP2 family protein [Phycisphaerae bacterium]|nr:phosphatase PAP2 family protein [Phycisphaerae bacterium]